MTAGIGWSGLLEFPLAQTHRLGTALLTTYDAPDARLLVEHMLPSLLGVESTADADDSQRDFYLDKLRAHLRPLRRRFAVVSSGHGQGTENPHPWLWNYVWSFTVGAARAEAQHSKLWLLEWIADDEHDRDTLEIVVSSANLTRNAFKGQIQAWWRATLPLGKASAANLETWGALRPFIEALQRSCGLKDTRNLAGVFSRARDLLARAACPPGVTFIASVPGHFSSISLRRQPWGAALLARYRPNGKGRTRVLVSAPSIGEWTARDLSSWSARSGSDASHLELIWVDKQHPWASSWQVSRETLQAFETAGASLRRLLRAELDGEYSEWHPEHDAADPRWSHAKLYRIRRGRIQKVLVSSANFSRAAWGAVRSGGLSIANFELGVLLDAAPWPNRLCPEELGDFAECEPALGEPRTTEDRDAFWGLATWDGRRVRAWCSNRAVGVPVSTVNGSRRRCRVSWKRAGRGQWSAVVPWKEHQGPPFELQSRTREGTIRTPILDVRPPGAAAGTMDPASVDRDERFLLERYGAAIAVPEDELKPEESPAIAVEGPGRDTGIPSVAHHADYSVASVEAAREWFEIVDCWRDRHRRANDNGNALERRALRADGAALRDLFLRRSSTAVLAKDASRAVAARLVAEEIGWWLEARK